MKRIVLMVALAGVMGMAAWGCSTPSRDEAREEQILGLDCWQAGQKIITARAPRRVMEELKITQKDGLCITQVVKEQPAPPPSPTPTATFTPTPAPTATKVPPGVRK